MSIASRFVRIAKSELNSLLDRAAHWEDERQDGATDAHDHRRPMGQNDSQNSGFTQADYDEVSRRAPRSTAGLDLSQLTDEELTAEIERRHRARTTGHASAGSEGDRRARPAAAGKPAERPYTRDPVRRAYAALELPYGAGFSVVKKAFREQMRKYHPDHHSGSPAQQKLAHELTLQLTEAYQILEQHLLPRAG